MQTGVTAKWMMIHLSPLRVSSVLRILCWGSPCSISSSLQTTFKQVLLCPTCRGRHESICVFPQRATGTVSKSRELGFLKSSPLLLSLWKKAVNWTLQHLHLHKPLLSAGRPGSGGGDGPCAVTEEKPDQNQDYSRPHATTYSISLQEKTASCTNSGRLITASPSQGFQIKVTT